MQIKKQKETKKVCLAAGTRTPVPRVRVLYPNHLDYSEPLDDTVAGSGALIPGPKSESLVS